MQLIFYTPVITSRVEYIVSTLLSSIGINDFEITSDDLFYKSSVSAKINYSLKKMGENEIWLKPVSLLIEHDIKNQQTECFQWHGNKVFFKTEGDIPFDIFAASFYLLARYEEYLPHQLDEYGRFSHKNSLAYKENFLDLPLVNLWLQRFIIILKEKFQNIILAPTTFKFLPTYDIDIAWNYRQKGFVRNAGGAIKSLLKGELNLVKERLAVLSKKQKDPFDIFDWLSELHKQNNIKPLYFFLLVHTRRGYDKNINPANTAFKDLIRLVASSNNVGIHPSWQSGDDINLLSKEIKTLKEITQKEIKKSRQHYIRMTLPETYTNLMNNGIEQDYSMGYGSINGFRASFCLPYKWYDLKSEKTTNLTIFPFCYMDANSYYEQHYTVKQARQELQHYLEATKKVNGLFITIFHNHTLGNKQLFDGWAEMYEEFCRNLDLEGL